MPAIALQPDPLSRDPTMDNTSIQVRDRESDFKPGEQTPHTDDKDTGEDDKSPPSRNEPNVVAGLRTVLLVGISFALLCLLCRSPLAYWISGHNPPPPSVPILDDTALRDLSISRGPDAINGVFPLFDSLSLSTSTGDISVTIVPQSGSSHSGAQNTPARLRIRSDSGNVVVSFAAPAAASIPEFEPEMRQPVHAHSSKDHIHNHGGHAETVSALPPPRKYEIDVESRSGSIAGRFLFSTSLRLVAGATADERGSIRALLIPLVLDDDKAHSTARRDKVSIFTRTGAGNQSIRITEPVVLGGRSHHGRISAGPAVASHLSGKGSLQLGYPPSWTGTVHARTGRMNNQEISLGGKGLDVLERVAGGVKGRRVWESEPGEDESTWWGANGDMRVSAQSVEGEIFFLLIDQEPPSMWWRRDDAAHVFGRVHGFKTMAFG
ncbi:hypothetical protein N7474_004236 [Penicillium riverlandense]|uniref:uncharacterized protein n=1 Tax=Penicillium riverlandense TaxID=1903569 RepID=UPI00254757DB|nr:uncharacterized protein N7474_004236 [Penicillium riverlandense]KAJ5818645.1 hypothetical protein N7474_004236 [Penicillium riverlandense]